METGSLFNFLKTVKSSTAQFNSDNVIIAWDRKLSTESNFRKVLSGGLYKGNRDLDRNQEVYSHMNEILECTEALGIKNMFPGTLEADDVISWLSKNIEGKKIIISVDNDFAQLVTHETSFYNPIKKITIDNHNFEEVFNMNTREFVYFKAIVGDVSDNIIGIDGFGKVKGTKLAKAFARNEEKTIEPYKQIVEENLKLVNLQYSLDIHPEECDLYKSQYTKLENIQPDFSKFESLCVGLEFNSILMDLTAWKKTFSSNSTNKAIVDFCKLFE